MPFVVSFALLFLEFFAGKPGISLAAEKALASAKKAPPLKIAAAARMEKSAFLSLAPGVELRFGSDPLRIELKGARAELEKGKLILGPLLKAEYLKTEQMEGEIWKCVQVDENAGSEISLNKDAGREEVKLIKGSYDDARKTLALNLPLPAAVAASTSQIQFRLELPAGTHSGVLTLEKPFVLPPLLTELLKQYQKIGPAVVWPAFPPKVARVKADECGDTSLETLSFANPGLLGEVSGYRMVENHGWVFAALAKEKEKFPFSKVDMRAVTFLGDTYSLEFQEAQVKGKTLTAIFELGDFSGCFGAGCGTPSNPREAHVSITEGKMSTKIVQPKAPAD